MLMKKLLVILSVVLVMSVLIAGCGPRKAATAPAPTGVQDVDQVSSDISDIESVDSDLDLGDLENLDKDLENLDW